MPSLTKSLWRGFEISVGLVAIWALYTAIQGNDLSRKAIHQSKITSAWQIIATPGVGNTGKKDALEIIYSEGYDLSGIDISCESMAGYINWNSTNAKCKKTIIIGDLKLNKNEKSIIDIFDINFSGTEIKKSLFNELRIYNSSFVGSNLYESSFLNSFLGNVNFKKSNMQLVNFKNSTIENSDFSEAHLGGADFSSANFFFINVSDTRFCGFTVPQHPFCAKGLTQELFDNFWAWEKHLPDIDDIKTHSDIRLELGFVCPLDLLDEWRAIGHSDHDEKYEFVTTRCNERKK